jgi:hypothetical protein
LGAKNLVLLLPMEQLYFLDQKNAYVSNTHVCPLIEYDQIDFERLFVTIVVQA